MLKRLSAYPCMDHRGCPQRGIGNGPGGCPKWVKAIASNGAEERDVSGCNEVVALRVAQEQARALVSLTAEISALRLAMERGAVAGAENAMMRLAADAERLRLGLDG